MAEITTEDDGLPYGSGPYLARVLNHLDSSFMGGLEVLLYYGSTTGDSSIQGQTVTVKYLPHFYGTTQNSPEAQGNNSADYNSVQKSYGMWFVPPDIGTTVMCFFIGGNRQAGFYIGCVPDTFMDQMIPGIAASRDVAITPEQQTKYGTTYLPVAEYAKKVRSLDKVLSPEDVNKFTKPVHPFADVLLAQGLLLDDIRGVTSSSARREHPSSVFGISTPGPIDTAPGAPQAPIGYGAGKMAFLSRKGGHQFVMDDGDSQGLNELFRLRTRTGHQILLHNSSDLIYIANAKGTAWIELTSQGKIDIYAADSVSIHSEGDFNLRADRDFNIEAGRNLNMVSGTDMQIESGSGLTALVGQTLNVKAGNDANIASGTDLKITAKSDLNLSGSDSVKMGSAGDIHIVGKGMYQTAAGDFNVVAGGNYFESAGEIHMNGPAATSGTAPDTADTVEELPRYNLPNRAPGNWSQGNSYKAGDLVSIMTRVPTHEPWDQHENINPASFSLSGTDVQNINGPSSANSASVTYNRNPDLDTPPKPQGDTPTDNIAAWLWMIRVAEGTADKLGFQGQFPSQHFAIDDPKSPSYKFQSHPGTVQVATGKGGKVLRSSAAGAYQFTNDTWAGCLKALNLPDFSPESQNKAAIYLTQRRQNALEDVKAGRFSVAIQKCKKEWASFPNANYPGQGTRTVAQMQQWFRDGGGTIVA